MEESGQPELTPVFPGFLPDAEVIRYRLSGRLADSALVPADDLIASLQGLSELLIISERLIALQRTTTYAQLSRIKSPLRVAPASKGSWDAALLWVFTLWASATLSPHVPKINQQVGTWLWEHVVELLNVFIASKEQAIDTLQLAQSILTYYRDSIISAVDPEQLAATVRLIDDSLRRLTQPLDDAAGTLLLQRGDSTIALDEGTRRIITELLPDAEDQLVDEPYDAWVHFVRLNNKTGRGLINFLDDPDHQRHCIIRDEQFETALNPYDKAFADRGWLRVSVQEVTAAPPRRHRYWIIIDTNGQRFDGSL